MKIRITKTQSGPMPELARVDFRTGVTLDKKTKAKNRKGKHGQRQLRRDLNGE